MKPTLRVRALRVFEAFAGIGAQSAALKRLGAKYRVVGTCEWLVDAVICYDAIHHYGEDFEASYGAIPDYQKQIEYLSQFEFSRDSVKPTKLNSLGQDVIEQLYIANKRNNNYGSINHLTGKVMPNCDLLIYSFPCQDLSTGGNCKGMKKDSGTRSSLLWEIARVLRELHALNKLPRYLLMENVKTILSDRYKEDLTEFLKFLESIGYKNDDPTILNAKDFGIPQDRVRAFIASTLSSKPLKISKSIKTAEKTEALDAMKFLRLDYGNEVLRVEADIAQLNKTPSRQVMWELNGMAANSDTIIRTITCNMDRTRTAALFYYAGAKGNSYRRLTIREAFLFMGFTEEEYERTTHLEFTYRRMNRLIGNSIVVDVLAAIFREMFAGRYGIEQKGK